MLEDASHTAPAANAARSREGSGKFFSLGTPGSSALRNRQLGITNCGPTDKHLSYHARHVLTVGEKAPGGGSEGWPAPHGRGPRGNRRPRHLSVRRELLGALRMRHQRRHTCPLTTAHAQCRRGLGKLSPERPQACESSAEPYCGGTTEQQTAKTGCAVPLVAPGKRGTTGGKLCACVSRTPARKACERAQSAVCAAVASAHASAAFSWVWVGAVAHARVLRPQYWESEARGCPPLQCACAAPPPAGPRRDRCGAAEPGRAPGRWGALGQLGPEHRPPQGPGVGGWKAWQQEKACPGLFQASRAPAFPARLKRGLAFQEEEWCAPRLSHPQKVTPQPSRNNPF